MKAVSTIAGAVVIARSISTPSGPRPDMDTLVDAIDFINVDAMRMIERPIVIDIEVEHEGAVIRFSECTTLEIEPKGGGPLTQQEYLLGHVEPPCRLKEE